MLTAVQEGRITLDDLIARMVTNPRRIFHLPEQPETSVEVLLDAPGEITAKKMFSRCGWTPFESYPISSKVQKVTLRGKTVFENDEILAPPGYGKNIRTKPIKR